MIPAALFTPPTASSLALLEGIGGAEMLLVAVIGLLLFGGKGLPDMARTFGKAMREFKKATSAVENEVRKVMEDEPSPPMTRRLDQAHPAKTAKPPVTLPESKTIEAEVRENPAAPRDL